MLGNADFRGFLVRFLQFKKKQVHATRKKSAKIRVAQHLQNPHAITMINRKQLTLFVPKPQATALEALRARYNPLQKALIDSHVTLCREDELQELETLLQRLRELTLPTLSISFGPVARFENGEGVWLPASGNLELYYELRARILGEEAASRKRPLPHITLMHPRNSTCSDAIFEHFKQAELPGAIVFSAITLIEQVNGGPWSILEEFPLSELLLGITV